MNTKASFKSAYSLFRYWKAERSCCPDQHYLSSDRELFVRAAGRHALDAGLACKIVQSCIADCADRLLVVNEHVTGCIAASHPIA